MRDAARRAGPSAELTNASLHHIVAGTAYLDTCAVNKRSFHRLASAATFLSLRPALHQPICSQVPPPPRDAYSATKLLQ